MLLYDILCEALMQRVPLDKGLLRIVIGNFALKAWDREPLTEHLKAWAIEWEIEREPLGTVLQALEEEARAAA